MSIAQLKNLGREAVVNKAVEQIRRQDPGFDPAAFDRVSVRGNAELVMVEFVMTVRFFPAGISEAVHAIEVVFTANDVSIDPEPGAVFKATPEYRQIVAALHKSNLAGHPDIRDVEVRDTGDAYSISVYRRAKSGYTGGAEGYRLVKKSGVIEQLWHELPQAQSGAPVLDTPIGATDLKEIE